MKEVRARDFEYYENQASYFEYTHDPDTNGFEFSDEYDALDPKIVETVIKRGVQDKLEKRKKRSEEQLSEFVVSEGLLTKENTAPVLYDLHIEYSLAYDYGMPGSKGKG